MELLEIDRLCDDYESRRKSGEKLTAEKFLEQRNLPRDPKLLKFLRSVEQEYDTPKDRENAKSTGEADVATVSYVADRGSTGHVEVVSNAQSARGANCIGDHQVLEKLGHGGMGVVYKARHLKLDRLVALKMVLAGKHASPKVLARFRDEAEAAARLNHPNIVAIYDVGEHDGMPYFTSEFVDGQPLSELLRESPLAAKRAAEILETLARAVEYSHQRGIVHRDLKPQNILLTNDGVPKIADFGLAKRLDGSGSDQTETGAVVGTPGFMAPEQAKADGKVGPSVDVYALGAVLYAMLTGSAPFKAPTPIETINLLLKEPPVPPSRMQPHLDRDIETICMKCLHKDVERRYASASDLADDVQRFIEGRPIAARPISRAERVWMWCKREPKDAALIGSALASLLFVMVVGYVLAAKLGRQRDQISVQSDEIGRQKDEYREIFYGLDEFFLSNPELTPLREQLFEIIVTQMKDPSHDDDGILRASAARHQGELLSIAGRHEQSLEKFLEAERLAQELHERGELTLPYMNFATLDKWIGIAYRNMEQFDKAEQRFLSMIENRREYFERHPQLTEFARLRGMGEAYGLLASLYHDLGRREDAVAYITKAVDASRQLLMLEPDRLDLKEDYAGQLGVLASHYADVGDLEKMEQARKLQVQLLAEVVAASPDTRRISNLSMAEGKLGQSYLIARSNQEAFEVLDDATRQFEKLLKKSFVPMVVRYNSAGAYKWLGIALGRLGEQTEARDSYARSVEIYDELVEKHQVAQHKRDRLLVLARAGMKSRALEVAQQMAETGEGVPYAALAYGFLANQEADPEAKSQLTDKAIELTRRFIRSGYRNFKILRGETDYDFAEMMKLDGYAEMLDEEEARNTAMPATPQ